jgi:ribonuclease G
MWSPPVVFSGNHGLTEKQLSNKILVQDDPHQTRLALIEDGRVVEIRIELKRYQSQVGSIYRGRVSRVVPGLEAAFVDIGLDRDAYLYVGDMRKGPNGQSGKPAPTPDGSIDEGSMLQPVELEPPEPPEPIEKLVQAGQLLTVQVSKDAISTKGVRVTTNIGIPGRYLVYLPKSDELRISRRIEDEDERGRLSAMLGDQVQQRGGAIVRTAGEGHNLSDFEPDFERLFGRWLGIQEKEALADSPRCLYREEGLAVRWARDVLSHETETFLVDGEAAYREVLETVTQHEPNLADRVQLWKTDESLFSEYGIDHEIAAALRNRVWLKSGGSLIIESTEALIAIDVNTGRNVGKDSLEKTVLATNLEAASEIVRQIRIRGLSGIIVIDFIDMENLENREQVYAAL